MTILLQTSLCHLLSHLLPNGCHCRVHVLQYVYGFFHHFLRLCYFALVGWLLDGKEHHGKNFGGSQVVELHRRGGQIDLGLWVEGMWINNFSHSGNFTYFTLLGQITSGETQCTRSSPLLDSPDCCAICLGTFFARRLFRSQIQVDAPGADCVDAQHGESSRLH